MDMIYCEIHASIGTYGISIKKRAKAWTDLGLVENRAPFAKEGANLQKPKMLTITRMRIDAFLYECAVIALSRTLVDPVHKYVT